eukprot:2125026-Rhodomonas_salina.2
MPNFGRRLRVLLLVAAASPPASTTTPRRPLWMSSWASSSILPSITVSRVTGVGPPRALGAGNPCTVPERRWPITAKLAAVRRAVQPDRVDNVQKRRLNLVNGCQSRCGGRDDAKRNAKACQQFCHREAARQPLQQMTGAGERRQANLG